MHTNILKNNKINTHVRIKYNFAVVGSSSVVGPTLLPIIISFIYMCVCNVLKARLAIEMCV